MPGAIDRGVRILHVLADLSPGGAERLVLAHARATPGVVVATVFGGGPLESAFAGLPLVLGERRRGRPSAKALARLVRAARSADVVHTHLFAGNLWGGLAARLAGRPQLAHEHNVEVDETTAHRAARRIIAGWPRQTLAVSEAVARYSVGNDVRVVENGVDLARFAAPWRGGGGVLAIGRLVPQKGFDVLLAALPEAVSARIVGDGRLAPPHPRVSWLGLRDDVPALLAEADVLVVPSRWEGFGLVALEGMAAGVPVIATNVGGLGPLVGDAGVLVPPGDVQALGAALARVLGDRGLREELSRRGRARSAQFSLSRTFGGWAAACARLVAPGPRGA